jgi:hypothetical protein
MKAADLIPEDHEQRLHAIIDNSWRIFKSHFIGRRHPILKEAPFQHHFANIISTVGALYCIKRDDVFFVDLETKCANIKNKSKYLDITCSFENQKTSCAIELKFKTALQGAQDHGRIDAYIDIEAIELACKSQYKFGRFYMITDSQIYVNPSTRGVGTVFCLHDGFQVTPNVQISYPSSVGRENVKVFFHNSYRFEWTQIDKWYFLEVKI